MRTTFIRTLLISTFVASTVAFAPSRRTSSNPVSTIKSKRTVSTSLALSPVDAWQAYNDALNSSPLLTKSCTAGVILGLADFAGQFVEQKQGKSDGVDVARAARFAIFGLVLQAPWNHFYYLLLDSKIPPTEDPFTTTNGIKVFIDQFIQAPVFTVLIFVFLGLLEGKSVDSIKEQLENDYGETIVANWKLWVPATAINIGFVPPIFRVLYLNLVFFFWSIYLSLVLNKKEEA